MALRKRMKDMAFFTESNIPAALLGMPADWSAENIRQYQEFLDEWLGGDIPRRSNLTLVPSSGGVPVHEFAPFSGDPTFDKWLMQITCAALDVTPAEIGFTDDVNRSSGEGQEDVQLRAQRPLIGFVKGIVDRVLADYLHMPFLEWHSLEGESDDDLNRAQVHQIYLGVGVLEVGTGTDGPLEAGDVLLALLDRDPGDVVVRREVAELLEGGLLARPGLVVEVASDRHLPGTGGGFGSRRDQRRAGTEPAGERVTE